MKQFLPRFNRRFQIPAQFPEPAFRPLPGDLPLELALRFKRHRRVAKYNTGKFQSHTLQLLTSRKRYNYARAAGC